MYINFQQIGFVNQSQYGAYYQNLRNNHICLPALIPSTPLLCETRWTAKYKSIRLFCQNFIDIHASLHHLSQNGSSQHCRTHATQLYHSSNNSNFIICLIIIARYSSMLEPVTQMLQAVEIDIITEQNHISNLIHQFTNHRDSCDDTFKTLYSEIQELSVELDIEVSRPRLCKKQTKRSNYTVESTEDYYRVSIIFPTWMQLLIV